MTAPAVPTGGAPSPNSESPADFKVEHEDVASNRTASPNFAILGRMPVSVPRRILALSLSWALLASPAAAQSPPGTVEQIVYIIRDAETETLLRTIGNPLFRAAGIEPGLVRIVLIQNSAINSFVSTGNRLFIHTGLIIKADSALEIAGVLAHEAGHIAGGHLAKLPEAMRQALIQSIAAVLVAAAAGVATRDGGAASGIALGGQQIAQRSFLSFARGMEQSADQHAMIALDRNKWSARGLLDLFHHLENEMALVPELQDPYMVTHPLTRDRIAFVEEHVRTSPYSNNGLPPGYEQQFLMFRAKLRAYMRPSSITLRETPETDRSAPARYARAIALHRLGHSKDALPLLDQLLAEQRTSPWLHELRGQFLFENGRVREAMVSYQEAVRFAPEQAQIRTALGRSMIETGDPLLLRPAVQQLQAALDRERDDPETWRALAVAWGKLNDIGQAQLALAEEAMINNDIRTARNFAARAEKLLPGGPSKLRAIDISNAVKKENREGF